MIVQVEFLINQVTPSGKFYSLESVKEAISKIDMNNTYGMLVHEVPVSFVTKLIDISHKLDNVFIEDNQMKTDISFMPLIEKSMILSNSLDKVKFVPRMTGTINENGEVSNLNIISIDAIAI